MNARVIYGGDSPEREVSMQSGPYIADMLRRGGYDVEEVSVTTASDAVRLLAGGQGPVFIALHGSWGEDGRLQAFLELTGTPYVGSGPKACQLAMDKRVSKALFVEAGLLTPAGTLVRESKGVEALEGLRQALSRYERLVVKPNCGGSSVGTSVVEKEEQLLPALQAVWALGDDALVEQFVPGRELSVVVYDGPFGSQTLPITEILPCSGFYDFNAKYADAGSCYETPAALPDEVAEKVRDAALAAYRALGCRDYARVDFRLNPDGDAYVLEANTVPGATAHSLVPMAVAAGGMEHSTFYCRLLSGAVCGKA